MSDAAVREGWIWLVRRSLRHGTYSAVERNRFGPPGFGF